MREALDAQPESIEAEGIAVFQNLFRFVLQQAGDLEAGDVEREVVHGVAAMGRLVLQAFLSARDTGDVGWWLEGDDRSIYVREGRVHTRVYLSMFGKVEVRRSGYRERGKPAVIPLDAMRNLPERRYSCPLQEDVFRDVRSTRFRRRARARSFPVMP